MSHFAQNDTDQTSPNKPASSEAGVEPSEQAEPASGRKMLFWEHLEELRRVLLWILLSLGAGCALVALFLREIAFALNWPLSVAVGEGAGKLQGLVTTSPMGVFSVVFQVCFLGGFALALPFILYFVARFIAPGLNRREVAVLRPGCVAAFGLFWAGSSFSYFILVPASLRAAMFFNQLLGFELIWSADRYYGLLVWMVLGVGFSFEFPLILLLLVYTGILNTAKLRAYRPHSIVAFLVLAALITPSTDPFTFLFLAIPMTLLYEVSIWLSSRLEQRRERDA